MDGTKSRILCPSAYKRKARSKPTKNLGAQKYIDFFSYIFQNAEK
jgi:hypothetical protein